jgi:hypothetical protein
MAGDTCDERGDRRREWRQTARKENLEVRARWRDLGTTSDWTRIHADPDSVPELMRHLETIARYWRRLGPDNVWLTDYDS